MQVDLGHVVERDVEHFADSGGAGPLPSRGEVRDLEHQHVAAVAAAALEQAAGGGAGAQRRDDLQERVAEREHGVAQAEVLDAGIRERLAEV